MIACPRHSAGPSSSNRLFEWIMAGGQLLIAFTLALLGDSLDRGTLRLRRRTVLARRPRR